MKRAAVFTSLFVAVLGCGSVPVDDDPPGSSGGARAESSGGSRGSGGSAGSGGSGGQADPIATGGAGGGGTGGGALGTGGGGGSGTGGGGGSSAEVAPSPDAPPAATGQGPTALGKIVYTQDFEAGMAGMTRSPTNLPAERVQLVDDPLGTRGKVAKIVWQAGDNFRTSPNTQPRSWYSNASGYQIKPGTKVSMAWGFMWTDVAMDAFFAQNIGPGPVWEARVRANGRFQILCNQCGGNTPDMMMLVANRWYDFRVDMDWVAGGKIQFFIDGQMVHQSTMEGASANCHWDGGIYNTPGGTASNKTRTVYLSNLSMGER